MAEQKGSQVRQSGGMGEVERWLSAILGYSIVVTLISVPVLSIILLFYILFKFA